MGGSSGFSDTVRSLVAPYAPIKDEIVLVDASYLFYRLSVDLKLDLFDLDQDSPHLQRVIGQVSDAIVKEIDQFQGKNEYRIQNEQVHIVFEDRDSSKSIRRKRRGRKSKSSLLNKGIREAFLSKSLNSRAKGKKKIAKVMGRPPQWISHLIMANLSARGFKSLHAPSTVQADQIIIRMANFYASAGSKVSVLGNDRDFIAFSKPDTICRIMYTNRGRQVQLKSETVAEHLALKDSRLVPYVYAFSGCDDISKSIYRFGWKKAFQIAKASETLEDFHDKINERFGNSRINGPKIQIIKAEMDNLIGCKFILQNALIS